MTIAFTGGGSGGHFYPIIATAEAMTDLVREKHLLAPKLYFLAPTAFDPHALFENDITYLSIPAGKVRRYTSFSNVTGFFVTIAGIVVAFVKLFRIYPDVVVSKGGYGSVPTVIAAWLLHIPIVIHESDAKPGRANLLASHFATRIAISFESAAPYFSKRAQKKIARTGIPIRKALARIEPQGASDYLNLEQGIPTILILGGSQGAQRINEMVLSGLPNLVTLGNVIHQTGRANFKNVESVSQVILNALPNASRYHPVDYLSELSLQRAVGVSGVIVSRAGANSIAEIGLWKKPAIIIPIPESVSHDQRSNAYAYAQTGAASVIEEANLTPHVLVSEIQRILSDAGLQEQMAKAAAGFTNPDAARILANEVLAIALSHEV